MATAWDAMGYFEKGSKGLGAKNGDGSEKYSNIRTLLQQLPSDPNNRDLSQIAKQMSEAMTVKGRVFDSLNEDFARRLNDALTSPQIRDRIVQLATHHAAALNQRMGEIIQHLDKIDDLTAAIAPPKAAATTAQAPPVDGSPTITIGAASSNDAWPGAGMSLNHTKHAGTGISAASLTQMNFSTDTGPFANVAMTGIYPGLDLSENFAVAKLAVTPLIASVGKSSTSLLSSFTVAADGSLIPQPTNLTIMADGTITPPPLSVMPTTYPTTNASQEPPAVLKR